MQKNIKSKYSFWRVTLFDSISLPSDRGIIVAPNSTSAIERCLVNHKYNTIKGIRERYPSMVSINENDAFIAYSIKRGLRWYTKKLSVDKV